MRPLFLLFVLLFGIVSCFNEENDEFNNNVTSNQLKKVTLLLPSHNGKYVIDTNKQKMMEFSWRENYVTPLIEDKKYIFRIWDSRGYKIDPKNTDTLTEKLLIRKDLTTIVKSLPKFSNDTVRLKWNVSSWYNKLQTINHSNTSELILIIKK